MNTYSGFVQIKDNSWYRLWKESSCKDQDKQMTISIEMTNQRIMD